MKYRGLCLYIKKIWKIGGFVNKGVEGMIGCKKIIREIESINMNIVYRVAIE